MVPGVTNAANSTVLGILRKTARTLYRLLLLRDFWLYYNLPFLTAVKGSQQDHLAIVTNFKFPKQSILSLYDYSFLPMHYNCFFVSC